MRLITRVTFRIEPNGAVEAAGWTAFHVIGLFAGSFYMKATEFASHRKDKSLVELVPQFLWYLLAGTHLTCPTPCCD